MRWVFNPIALARLAIGGGEGRSRPWPDSWADVEDLFATAYKLDVRAVFYGSGDAPALIDLLRRAADEVQKPLPLNEVVEVPAVRALADQLANPEWLRRLLPFIVPVSDVNFGPGAEFEPALHPQIGDYEQIGALDVDGVSWLDAEQGSTADCYLISAIISLAWARPLTWRGILAGATREDKAMLHVQLNPLPGQEKPPRLNVPPKVPLDVNHNWIYAHSAARNETWPALIERAFVMNECHRDEPTVSDYQDIGIRRRFPHDAAQILTGGEPGRKFAPDAKPYPSLVDRCAGPLTKSPTMAWTWAKSDPPAAGLDWVASTLVDAHAYAVLGLMSNNNTNFVVLRNPFGHNPPVPDSPTGQWTEGAPRNGGAPVSLDANGVFAISEQRFNAFFNAVDWVELPPDPPA